MDSAAEWGRQRKESMKLKIQQQKLSSLSNIEKIDWGKKYNRILETCGTITKDPAFVLFESWNEERGAENEYEEIKAENFLKLTRNINIQI